jgi:hypothetical protein
MGKVLWNRVPFKEELGNTYWKWPEKLLEKVKRDWWVYLFWNGGGI